MRYGFIFRKGSSRLAFFSGAAALFSFFAAPVLLLSACSAGAAGHSAPSPAKDVRAMPNLHRFEEACAPWMMAAEREKLLTQIRQETIGQILARPFDAKNEEDYTGALWASELILDPSDAMRGFIHNAFADWPRLSNDFRRAILENAWTLFPGEFLAEHEALLPRLEVPKHFAMAANYVLRSDNSPDRRAAILALIRDKFPKYEENPILRMLGEQVSGKTREALAHPPALRPLLAHDFGKGRPVLFSFQRQDRRWPGLAVIRLPNGRFARRADGSLVAIPQMAYSITNLPGYLTNGNTPRGVHSINGMDITKSKFIGPTPFLWSRLPFEIPPEDFFHRGVRIFQPNTTLTADWKAEFDAARAKPQDDPPDSVVSPAPASPAPADSASDSPTTTPWTPEQYAQLLPPEWRGYAPMWEAYYAGQAGRSEILTHGTAIDPEYYHGQVYYPNTPSLGCLCALELWSPEDGCCLMSRQLELLHAWLSGGQPDGYAVVAELDAAPRPVALEEVVMDILAAEAEPMGQMGKIGSMGKSVFP